MISSSNPESCSKHPGLERPHKPSIRLPCSAPPSAPPPGLPCDSLSARLRVREDALHHRERLPGLRPQLKDEVEDLGGRTRWDSAEPGRERSDGRSGLKDLKRDLMKHLDAPPHAQLGLGTPINMFIDLDPNSLFMLSAGRSRFRLPTACPGVHRRHESNSSAKKRLKRKDRTPKHLDVS